MKIEKLIPTGFCYGVMYSYKSTLEIISKNPDKKIYMLGWLVHNQYVISELLSHNLIILDDKDQTRYELINNFPKVENAILILSAHGTDIKTINLAKSKGFEIHDLTCRYVYKTHDIIKQKLSEGYEILFIGKHNHPESNAILSIDDGIKLVSSIECIDQLNLNKPKLFCTNQTTFNIQILNDIVKKLQDINRDIIFENEICNATKMRQNTIINMSPTVDVCIIIGDLKSSNANELYEISKNKVSTYFITNVVDIHLEWFINKKHCVIAGAASTPIFLIEQVYNYLLNNITD